MDHSRKFPFRNFAPVSHSHQFSGCSFVAFGFPLFSRNPVFFLTSLAHRRVSLRRAGITSLLGPVDHRCLVDGVHGYPHDFGKRPLWYFKCVFQFWSFYFIYIYTSYHHDIYIYLSIYLWSYCWIPQIIRIWRYFMIFQYWPHGDLGNAHISYGSSPVGMNIWLNTRLLIDSHVMIIWATAKTPAILNMYGTDIGLWKFMEIVENTR